MEKRSYDRDRAVGEALRSVLRTPPREALSRSRDRIEQWFSREAPPILWGEMRSPLGPLFAAVTPRGLWALEFGRPKPSFLARLGSRARVKNDPRAVAPILAQLRDYFRGRRTRFDVAVDLTELTSFQRRVLEVTCRIAPGEVRTYQEVARALGKPRASRPVGQALARNPVPIVIPCHRVLGSNGSLCGYSGGAGLAAKRWLLRLEGAL
ncbi:MAG TPA: methylated-DNA--[protein]-cysteine S-methyltransferase [candidate division Zixibacteria bacterium]|nr:methylated-DNA--[protein]-cysteine S-methyltransferase [candidate division Zixibacteria bacterium]